MSTADKQPETQSETQQLNRRQIDLLFPEIRALVTWAQAIGVSRETLVDVIADDGDWLWEEPWPELSVKLQREAHRIRWRLYEAAQDALTLCYGKEARRG